MKKTFKIEDIEIIQLRNKTTWKGGYFMVVKTKNNETSKFEIVMSLDMEQAFDNLEMAFTENGIKVERV